MRTTLTLDDDVYEAAMTRARVSGLRLGQVISELVRESLRRPAAIAKSGRFPTFRVSENAPVIPASRIRDFLDDEGEI